jgi:hypothetical protein
MQRLGQSGFGLPTGDGWADPKIAPVPAPMIGRTIATSGSQASPNPRRAPASQNRHDSYAAVSICRDSPDAIMAPSGIVIRRMRSYDAAHHHPARMLPTSRLRSPRTNYLWRHILPVATRARARRLDYGDVTGDRAART